jgi:hypothetical protein
MPAGPMIRTAIQRASRTFPQGDLPVLRETPVGAVEDVAAVGRTQRWQRKIVIAVALQVDGIDIVELSAYHPSVVDAQAGLEGARICVVVRRSGEAGLEKRIRRHAGERGDRVGRLGGCQGGQLVERVLVEIKTGRLEHLVKRRPPGPTVSGVG